MHKKRILLFDTITDGHHPDYLYNLMLYFGGREDVELLIVTGEKFLQFLDQYTLDGALPWTNIFLHTIPLSQLTNIHQKLIYRRSVVEWNLMLQYAEDLKADKALVMYMDYFQLGMILGKKASIDLSGICFRPDFTKNDTSFYGKVKKYMLKLAMNSGNLKTLFTLDARILSEIQALSDQTKVVSLCEPIQLFDIKEEEVQVFKSNVPVSTNKIRLINFGFLDERKGIEVFLEACKYLTEEEISQISLRLIGPVELSYQAKIEARLNEIKSLEVHTIWGYLPAREVQIAFEQSDWALVLYQNHIGSSSVVVRAALAGKPTLATNMGQIGELIQEKHLGISVDVSNAKAVAKALSDIIAQNTAIDHVAIKQFANENSIQAFGNAIENGL
ncbi:glycosyltransferase [Aquirufa sp. ROCK2-A2]